ncbi:MULTISPECIES: amino acid ABC transporter permease [Rhizobium]|uniref:Amino acid ABC transporter permease n=1 Tax=Rhizobium rhododendri TaxID=2506430 RepID=A0ABY8IQI4_9HYPH|nr:MULTISPECIES: amino acid ABC transporter permease [Rhizobium]TQX85208.1 amino acid ABC transporter permease [Rhizobium sp. rho-13.1]TQY09496.1 amino acid ABC transporter permease [Rhizobium sp. rho-1.1]WFS25978.1 amino acid ABC transporter permease [Rhizobium rhododendri]
MLKDILVQIPQVFTSYNILLLAEAALTTLYLSAVGCLVGVVFGTLLSLARLSRSPLVFPFKAVAFVYVEVFRRVPFLVTLLMFFFGAQVIGLDLSPLAITVISTSIISTAFVAEIIRAALAAVSPSQLETAAVMNFSPWQILYHVRWPQAWPLILPPVFGYFVLFIKDTALASQIGVLELTQAGKILNTKGFSALLVFTTILVLYFLISYPLARLGTYLESYIGASRHSRSRSPLR